MIKAIIFDCFGVLITDALEAMVAELRETQPQTVQEIIDTVQAASRGFISREESSATIANLLNISTDEYIDQIKNGEVKNQPLLDYILELRKDYKTGLLSNISRGGLAVRFTPNELVTYFDSVIASGDIGFAKPEAEAYEIAADKLGVRLDKCVFIDDRQEYCDGAIRVGMQAMQYQSFEQCKRELTSLLGDKT